MRSALHILNFSIQTCPVMIFFIIILLLLLLLLLLLKKLALQDLERVNTFTLPDHTARPAAGLIPCTHCLPDHTARPAAGLAPCTRCLPDREHVHSLSPHGSRTEGRQILAELHLTDRHDAERYLAEWDLAFLLKFKKTVKKLKIKKNIFRQISYNLTT